MLKREMDVMNEYCAMNLPPEYRAELCHIENIKKLNIARLLQVIEYFGKTKPKQEGKARLLSQYAKAGNGCYERVLRHEPSTRIPGGALPH
jgi:hypothetical protein